jgi:hypothetical protein
MKVTDSGKKKKKKRRDMDAIDSVVDPLRDFAKDSIRLVKRCHKPDRKGITSFLLSHEFNEIGQRIFLF